MTDITAIACSLDAGDYQQRLAWIAGINGQHLREQHRDGFSLTLIYALPAASLVREMVRREQACCTFLTFKLNESTERVELTITVPEQARENADLLLAPFLETRTNDVGACCARGDCERANATTSPTSPSESPPTKRSALGALSTVVATGALACGVCCVLPFAFPAVALTSTGGLLAWLGRAHGWFTGVAVLVVLLGWVWIWRQSATRRARASRTTLRLMLIATSAAVLALMWPHLEPTVISLLVG